MLLLKGDYQRGWNEYEWRWQTKDFAPPAGPQPLWDGSPLAGRTILLYAEQGYGDTIHFVRYAPLVKRLGATVLLRCPEPLLPLLRTCPGIDQLMATDAAAPPFDVQAPLMSLPRLFGTTVATIPAQVPYLFADPALVDRWRARLASASGYKVGIVYQGNPKLRKDRQRSVPPGAFEPLAGVPGVHLFSLQVAPARSRWRRWRGRVTRARRRGQETRASAGRPAPGAGRPAPGAGRPAPGAGRPAPGAGRPAPGARRPAPGAVPRDRPGKSVRSLHSQRHRGSLDVPGPRGDGGHGAGPSGGCAGPAGVGGPAVRARLRWLLERGDSPWYPTMRLFRQARPGTGATCSVEWRKRWPR